MNAIERDKAIGRRLVRNGLRITRSDRQPYPFERLASYRAASACVPVDAVARGTRYLRGVSGHTGGTT